MPSLFSPFEPTRGQRLPSANARSAAADAVPALLLAVNPADVDRFPVAPYKRLTARTTTEAVRLIERFHPRLVAIDRDTSAFDQSVICGEAKRHGSVGILAVIADPYRAPSTLKIGCNAILLKPFPVNLAAARLGRLWREMPAAAAASRLGVSLQRWGTNRTWPEAHCPKCDEGNAVCFEYSSHRRSWYACLACEHAWLGPRRE